MAWTKEIPQQDGKYWVKLTEYDFLHIAQVCIIFSSCSIFVDGNLYSLKGKKLKDALFWDEPIQEPPKP